jgi:single-stranded DNA-binding protein
MGNFGHARTQWTNAHVTGIPTFFPSPDGNPDRNCLTMNITINERKRKDGTRPSVTMPVKVWGKFANVCAHQLKNGSAINVFGDLKTWRRDTGVVDAAGKRDFDEKISIRMDEFEHCGMTNKENAANIDRNLAAFFARQAQGLERPDARPTGEMLSKVPEPTVIVDYNPVISAQTGMYGNAKVWVKGIGFIGPQNAQAIAAAAAKPIIIAADPNAANTNAMLATLTQAVSALVAAQAGNKVPAATPVIIPEVVQDPAANEAVPVDAFAGVVA